MPCTFVHMPFECTSFCSNAATSSHVRCPMQRLCGCRQRHGNVSLTTGVSTPLINLRHSPRCSRSEGGRGVEAFVVVGGVCQWGICMLRCRHRHVNPSIAISLGPDTCSSSLPACSLYIACCQGVPTMLPHLSYMLPPRSSSPPYCIEIQGSLC